jgi:hypothetical protein
MCINSPQSERLLRFSQAIFSLSSEDELVLAIQAAVAEPRAKGAYTNIIAGSQSSVVGMNAAILL